MSTDDGWVFEDLVFVVKSPAARATWLDTLWRTYYADLVNAGTTPKQARENVERNQRQLFVDDEPVPGQWFFDVRWSQRDVGHLWLARVGDEPDEWFIYDVEVLADERGRGLGRRTMRAAEAFAREHGARRLSLNVFGPNEIARRLYESLGYGVRSVQMMKNLGE